MLLSGDLIDAATALRFGLVNQLAPAELPLAEAYTFAGGVMADNLKAEDAREASAPSSTGASPSGRTADGRSARGQHRRHGRRLPQLEPGCGPDQQPPPLEAALASVGRHPARRTQLTLGSQGPLRNCRTRAGLLWTDAVAALDLRAKDDNIRNVSVLRKFQGCLFFLELRNERRPKSTPRNGKAQASYN